jgi:hypothetical protein
MTALLDRDATGGTCGAAEPPPRRWFLLRAMDPVTDCPVLGARFAVADHSALRAVLGGDADDDLGLERGYHIDGDELRAVAAAFGVGFDPGDRNVPRKPFRAEGIGGAPYSSTQSSNSRGCSKAASLLPSLRTPTFASGWMT